MFRNILLIFMVTVLFAGGCSAEGEKTAKKESPAATEKMQAKESSKLPEGHPAIKSGGMNMMVKHGGMKTQRQVVVSDEIKAKWKSVQLEVTDRKLNTKDVLKVDIGKEVEVGKTGYSIKVEAFLPDYAVFSDHIGSRSTEPNNPAVLVELFKDDESVAKGWVFKNFPTFNSYQHERFALSLVAPAKK